MIDRLVLSREWLLGSQIGAGGFGSVYEAKSKDGESAVAKFVPKAPGAERELLFVDLTGVRNVVPVIDSGETGDSWVLVMPRAEKSLRQHLHKAGGPSPVREAVSILSDVVTALVDLDGRVVHRDLKPENILLLHGVWSLADFGISRYTEATTAPDTQKFALTCAYAAPERWRLERATIAADMYAVGVIAYELCAGALPFRGPDQSDFRNQHLHDQAPPLALVPPALAALVAECLYKAPEARPGPANALVRLGTIGEAAASPGLRKLEEANLQEVHRRAVAGQRESALRSEEERRQALREAALQSLVAIQAEMRDTIASLARTAAVSNYLQNGWFLKLGAATLEFASFQAADKFGWSTRRPPAFDVIGQSYVELRYPGDSTGYRGRSHSLWFCDAQEAGRYRWFETAFMISPLVPARQPLNPFKMNPSESAADALGTALAEYQVAWPFTPLQAGQLEDFIDRWANWLADAANGELHYPRLMPEGNPDGSWRRK